jgi:hypothetical protein
MKNKVPILQVFSLFPSSLPGIALLEAEYSKKSVNYLEIWGQLNMASILCSCHTTYCPCYAWR